MPFQFTGKPPAIQPAGSFATFTSSATRPSYSFAVSGSSSFSDTVGSPLATPPSFTSSFQSNQCTDTSQPQPRSVNARLLDDEKAALAVAAPDDLLMQGLKRAVHGRPALFGKAEMKVDEVLGKFINDAMAGRPDQIKAAQLSKEMRTVLESSALARSFVSHLLAQAAGVKLMISTSLVSRSPTPALAALEHSLGVPAFEDGSPAFKSIVTNFQEILLQKVLTYGDRLIDVCTHAKRAAMEISGGGSRVAIAQDYIGEVLSCKRHHPDAAEVTNALVECVHHAVYRDNLSTKGPAKAAKNLEQALFTDQNLRFEPLVAARPAANDSKSSVAGYEGSESTSQLPFRLMDLPAELRVYVYRELFSPTGYIGIRSGVARTDVAYQKHVITGLSPSNLTPALLRTSRLIYKEARDIIFENNTFYVNSQLVYGSTTFQSMIGHLPQDMLPRLRSIMLVVDAVATNKGFLGNPFHCDWRDLQYLTGLKYIRIVILLNHEEAREAESIGRSLLEHIIDRVPAKAKITFGARKGPEQEHVGELIRSLTKSKSGKYYKWAPFAVNAEALEECAKEMYVNQGRKSGSTRDFRWPEKKVFQLKPLAPLGGDRRVDESIVLGR